MNLMGYVEHGTDTLETRPFCALDATAFAWLIYGNYEPALPSLPVSLEMLGKDPYFRRVSSFSESFFPKKSMRFFRAISRSMRFKTSQILLYSSIRDKVKSIQFCAMAVRFGNDIVIIYEGTDTSREGWEEDFRMSYDYSIESYPLAVSFYEEVAQRFEGNIILTGHSKGGNVAEYVLAKANDDSRIIASYSIEGPGFRDPNIFASHPERTKKMLKYIPHGAIVGVIFKDEAQTKIVRSTQIALLQHDPFSWVIKNNDFVYRQKISRSSIVVEKAMNGWIDRLPNDDKKRFSSLFFESTAKMKVKDYTQFFKVLPLHIPQLYSHYRKFNPDDRDFCRGIISSLIACIREAMYPKKKKK